MRRPKLDGFTELIDQWLEEDRRRPRKQRHTAKRVFDRLRPEYGFSGSYTIVRTFGAISRICMKNFLYSGPTGCESEPKITPRCN